MVPTADLTSSRGQAPTRDPQELSRLTGGFSADSAAHDERGATNERVESGQNGASPSRDRILHNRVHAVILHIPWYGFRTQARLARDSGVSPAAISRLIRGRSQPSLAVALRLTRALSKRLGQPLDVFEVFSLDGTYPTASACRLTGCRNCLPPQAYDDEEELRPEYQRIEAGQWSVSLNNFDFDKGGGL